MSDDLVKHERIWVSWDKIGARVNTHGDKRFTPIDAREYVTADHIEQLAAINEELEAKRVALAGVLKQVLDSLLFADAELRAQAEIPYEDSQLMEARIDILRDTIASLQGDKT